MRKTTATLALPGIFLGTLMAVPLGIAMTQDPAPAPTTPTPAVVSFVQTPKLPAWMTTPCPEEDSVDCYWDATKAGNGVGDSFYSIRSAPGVACTIYWDHSGQNHCAADPYASARPALRYPAWMTRECRNDGQVNCRWTASRHDTGEGRSYVVREFPGRAHMVCVMYVNTPYGHRNDYCIEG